MAVVLEKVYVIPTIEAVRTTYQGDIYTVATPGYIDTVVVSGSRITCTCHEGHCDHIRTVERRRMVEATTPAAPLPPNCLSLRYGDELRLVGGPPTRQGV